LTQYQRGYRFELETKKLWEAKGYLVVRAAGSHGIADLVAIKNDSGYPSDLEVCLIQCKLTGKLSLHDRNYLSATARDLSVSAAMAYKEDGKYREEFI